MWFETQVSGGRGGQWRGLSPGQPVASPIAFAVIPPKQQSSNVSVHQSPGGLVTAQISRPHWV